MQGRGHDNHEPLPRRHQILELPAPRQPIARRQRNLLRDLGLCFVDPRADVAPPHVGCHHHGRTDLQRPSVKEARGKARQARQIPGGPTREVGSAGVAAIWGVFIANPTLKHEEPPLLSTDVKSTSAQTTQSADVKRADAMSTVPKFWQNAVDITSPHYPAAPTASRPDITSTSGGFTYNAPFAGNFTVVSPQKPNSRADVAATRDKGAWTPPANFSAVTLYPPNKFDITGNKSAFGGTSGSFTLTASPDVSTRVTWQQPTSPPDQPRPTTPTTPGGFRQA